MKSRIKIGIDFDGVLAYNPFRVIRAIVTFVKTYLLGIKKLSFFVPHNGPERFIWMIMHESSVFPARGEHLVKQMAKSKQYEFYLVTSRFGFLAPQLTRWINRWQFQGVFRELAINHHHEQPHEFKERIAKKLQLDYFIEDNWDIVQHLRRTTKTKIFWIYNLLDRGKEYSYKYPYLEPALKEIQKETEFR